MKANLQNSKHQILNTNRGITLVALIITMIVLLILATVSIQVLTGDNGLLTKTETAVQSNKDSQEEEKVKLAVSAAQLSGNGTITTNNLNNELRSNFEDNNISVEEKSEGWIFKRNREYKIYRDGRVKEEYVNYIIQLNPNKKYNGIINSKGWKYEENTGITLNVTERGDYYYYIPFMVPKTGEYLCRMMIEKMNRIMQLVIH